jgi:hypothetical protein
MIALMTKRSVVQSTLAITVRNAVELAEALSNPTNCDKVTAVAIEVLQGMLWRNGHVHGLTAFA